MRDKVLIVDDVAINRDILSEMLENRYGVIEAENGKEALDVISSRGEELALILLDLTMPVLDGFAVLETLRKQNYMERVPILVISGETSVESEKRCLDFGVADFIHKPFDETIVMCRVKNVTDLYEYKEGLEDKVALQTETLRRQNIELREQAEKLEKYNQTIVDILGTVVESRNLESGDHIQRVKGYTRILAETLMALDPDCGLTQREIEIIVSASSLHDVGKIAIPDSILLKPGRLTPEEFEEMKKHTTRGCELLDSIEGAWSEEYKRMSYVICRHHHEKYDGRGYPDGLAGEDIPLPAQIVSVADVYDALVSKRVYKDAYAKERAYEMIRDGECGKFSDRILSALAESKNRFEELAMSV